MAFLWFSPYCQTVSSSSWSSILSRVTTAVSRTSSLFFFAHGSPMLTLLLSFALAQDLPTYEELIGDRVSFSTAKKRMYDIHSGSPTLYCQCFWASVRLAPALPMATVATGIPAGIWTIE